MYLLLSMLLTTGAKAGGWCVGVVSDFAGNGNECAGCPRRFELTEVVAIHHESLIALCTMCAESSGLMV